jgi:phage terminase small subunit
MLKKDLVAGDPNQPLTLKQKKFVKEYAKLKNGSEAARRAGYSKKSASVIAAENLVKPNIICAVQKTLNEITEQLGVGAEWQLDTLKRVAEKAEDKERFESTIRAVNVVSEITGTKAPVKSVNAHLNIDVDEANLDDLINYYRKEF